MNKGQGSFEYVLILGGVLFMVVIAILLLNTVSSSGSDQALKNACINALVTQTSDVKDPDSALKTCYVKDAGTGAVSWKPVGGYTLQLPTECTGLVPDRATWLGSVPLGPGDPSSVCNRATDNFGFVSRSTKVGSPYDPSDVYAWCCGLQPV